MQQRIIELGLRLFVIDASRVAQEVGLRGRTNTVLQTCFFAISGVLPRERAIGHIKEAIRKSYGSKGEAVVQANFRAVDDTLARLFEVTVPKAATSRLERAPSVPADAPAFVREVTAAMLEGRGDEIPVSQMPVDGTWPSGTAVWEKRNIADAVPVWDAGTCIQCGQCSFVCPHGVIQAQILRPGATGRCAGTASSRRRSMCAAFPTCGSRSTSRSRTAPAAACASRPARWCRQKALASCRTRSRWSTAAHADNAFFAALPVNDRARVDFANVRGVQFLEPLFAFSGACAGCGETPYLKLLSQLFGDRMQIANATGCSSIYGGNLPVTPWSKNREGRGPAWSNSLFEDNAEFGLGFRLAADKHLEMAQHLARDLAPAVGRGARRRRCSTRRRCRSPKSARSGHASAN